MKVLHHSSLYQLIEVKLLGIDIDFRLNFNNHISNICKKASQQLNVLKRIENCLSRLNKFSIFHTCILSNFNFCPLAGIFVQRVTQKRWEEKFKNGLLDLSMKILTVSMKIF